MKKIIPNFSFKFDIFSHTKKFLDPMSSIILMLLMFFKRKNIIETSAKYFPMSHEQHHFIAADTLGMKKFYQNFSFKFQIFFIQNIFLGPMSTSRNVFLGPMSSIILLLLKFFEWKKSSKHFEIFSWVPWAALFYCCSSSSNEKNHPKISKIFS